MHSLFFPLPLVFSLSLSSITPLLNPFEENFSSKLTFLYYLVLILPVYYKTNTLLHNHSGMAHLNQQQHFPNLSDQHSSSQLVSEITFDYNPISFYVE